MSQHYRGKLVQGHLEALEGLLKRIDPETEREVHARISTRIQEAREALKAVMEER